MGQEVLFLAIVLGALIIVTVLKVHEIDQRLDSLENDNNKINSD